MGRWVVVVGVFADRGGKRWGERRRWSVCVWEEERRERSGWVGVVVEESEGEGRRRREKSKTNEKQKTGGIWSCNSRKKYTRIDDGTGTARGMHFVVSKRRRSCRRCG